MIDITKPIREKYLDILNIFACFAVIMMHISGIIPSFSPTFTWYYCLCVEVLFYFAVPVFLMISGANLLDYHKRYSTTTFFKKRFCRVAIPYLVWSFLYFWLVCKTQKTSIFDLDFTTVISNIIYCKSNPALYFLPLIMSLYLLMPVFTNFTNQSDRWFLWNLVKVYFIVGGIILPITQITPIHYIKFDILYNGILYILILKYLMETRTISWYQIATYTICFTFSYIIYYKTTNVLPDNLIMNEYFTYPIYILLGYLLATQNISKKQRMIVYILAIIAMLIRYIVMGMFSYKYNINYKGLNDYTYFISILQACAVYLLVKYSVFYQKINSKLLQNIAACSLGVYLIHILVISTIYALVPEEYSLITVPICTYIVSLIIVWLIRKNVLLKYLFGA